MSFKPLKVAVVVKPTDRSVERDCRNMGMWSYEVDEFSWNFLPLGKGQTLDTREYKRRGYDLIFVEDGGCYPNFKGDAIPNVFYSIDSTLSDKHHYLPRLEQARKADLVLVDHDRLERFTASGRPVRRLLYAVNDHLFHPRPKDLDVNFRCDGTPERAAVRNQLDALCKEHGYSFVSGTCGIGQYAEEMGRSKVVVILPRTPINRPHRLFDCMTSGAMPVCVNMMELPADERCGIYRGPVTDANLPTMVVNQVSGIWEIVAEMHDYFLHMHSWAARAADLRALLAKELGL